MRGSTLPSSRVWQKATPTLLRKISVEDLITEIGLYDSNAATAVGDQAREQASLDRMISGYLALYREALTVPRASERREEELALATARHLERWSPRSDRAWPWCGQSRTETHKDAQRRMNDL
jgi:hypothetical protein